MPVGHSGAQFEVKFFGWYRDEANNNDKIWGFVDVEGKVYNFWGRRADLDGKKKLTFKIWPGRWGEHDARDKAREKERKGYKSIPTNRTADGEYPEIEKVYGNFVKSFKNQLMLAKLTNNIKGIEQTAAGQIGF